MDTPLFEAKNLSWSKLPGHVVFSNVSFSIKSGDILVLTGKSGAGKSTLLKCLAHMNVYEGEIFLHGQPPKAYGIPSFRTRVLYIPQRPALLPGSPRAFHNIVHNFASRKQSGTDPEEHMSSAAYIASLWGIEDELWDRDWGNLSGGEAQRLALAIGLSIQGTEILLLDEPTSALDIGSAGAVEKYIAALPKSVNSSIQAIVWVTHSAEQAAAVGTRRLCMQDGGAVEVLAA